MAVKMVAKLDAHDKGQTARGRRPSDRGAYSRFTRAVAEAELSRFIKANLQAYVLAGALMNRQSRAPNSSTESWR